MGNTNNGEVIKILHNKSLNKSWVYTKALFLPEDYEKLKSLGMEVSRERYDFRFDLNEVVAYNESSEECCTTIVLKNGYDISIDIPIDVMDQIMIRCIQISMDKKDGWTGFFKRLFGMFFKKRKD